ncbi:MAG TPA: alpha-L-arabinofuranosidase C-terminal domain-containing protein, partial [Dehalococcoidia bacterium]|nr:alpha-L-arabinofuranosidase C-terminal domain-containing protein [Dehalococcoidia bacterium]
VAGFLNSFIRHADSVKIANLAQVVNVIAPILTRGDDLLVQSIFHAFAMFSKRRQGTSLRIGLDGPSYDASTHGKTSYIDASAIIDGELLHVFAVNRSLDEAAPLEVAVGDREVVALVDAEILMGPGGKPEAKAATSWEQRDAIASGLWTAVEVVDGIARTELPALSLLAATFRLA